MPKSPARHTAARVTRSKAQDTARSPSAVRLSAPNGSVAVQGLMQIAHAPSPIVRRSGRGRRNVKIVDV